MIFSLCACDMLSLNIAPHPHFNSLGYCASINHLLHCSAAAESSFSTRLSVSHRGMTGPRFPTYLSPLFFFLSAILFHDFVCVCVKDKGALDWWKVLWEAMVLKAGKNNNKFLSIFLSFQDFYLFVLEMGDTLEGISTEDGKSASQEMAKTSSPYTKESTLEQQQQVCFWGD